MPKKTLGKGLEDVSSLFLSNKGEKTQKKVVEGFSSLIIRKETCSSCEHLVSDPPEEPKCRIFTLESENHGVPHMDSISLNYAENCKHFKPIPSTNGDKTVKEKSRDSHPVDDESGVEEVVSVHRRIAYPNTENAQQDMRRAIFKYLENDYQIRSMTLRKIDRKRGHGKGERREEVTLYFKGP